ncbi:MAG: sulfite exporter TauE/SafE family protein [Elusimicrobiota bacterium]
MIVHLAGSELAILGAITLLAAAVNGALGYGFSSITVPVALLYLTNRVLNPAMVLVEVAVNTYTMFINRRALGRVFMRTLPIIMGVLPGVLVGSYLLFRVSPDWLKLATYALLLPLILLQAGGLRRQIESEKAVGFPFGFGVGVLYSLTTISGPPLAVMLNNQGYAKEDFRAALGLVRTAESVFTACSYYFLGLYGVRSLQLAGSIVPSIVIGIPIGAYAIRHMNPETFRRICMSFDAWVVGFGISKVLTALHLAAGLRSYSVLTAVAVIDAVLLFSFFAKKRDAAAALAGLSSAELTPE